MSEWYNRQGEPITMQEWGRLLEESKKSGTDYRRVGWTNVWPWWKFWGKPVNVSTVWLGLNHAWGEDQQPLIFETMIFGGVHDQYQARYSTEADAVKGHARAVALARRGIWKELG